MSVHTEEASKIMQTLGDEPQGASEIIAKLAHTVALLISAVENLEDSTDLKQAFRPLT